MNATVRHCLALLGHGEVTDLTWDTVAGGSISEAMRIRWRGRDGATQHLFAKRNAPPFEENYRCEVDGLERLDDTHTIRVPKPALVTTVDGSAWAPSPHNVIPGRTKPLSKHLW